MAHQLYRSVFSSSLSSASNWQNDEVSRASLEGLRPLIPSEIDLSENPDLISIAFNGAVGNVANSNDDCVGVEESIRLVNTTIHKALNLEHKAQKIVGHVVKSGFSSFGGNEILSESDVRDLGGELFNMSFGAVVYDKIYPDLGKIILKSTDPKDKFYQSVSASFEVAFSSYHIMIGSKFAKDAEIVSDPKQVKELAKYLRKYGGSGFLKDDGKTRVYRKIVDKDILAIGYGLVSKPAANVKGVIVETEASQKTAKAFSFFSGAKKSVITNNSNKLMDLEKLIQEMHASLVKLTEEKSSEQANANLAKELAPKLKELNAEWIATRDSALKEKEAAESKMTELYAQVEKMSKQLSDAEQKLWAMEENSRATKALIRYNERMAAMSEQFEMDEEDLSLVASKLKNLEVKDEDGDTVFASFVDEMNKFWKHKNKASIAKAREEFEARVNEEVRKKITETTAASKVTPGEEASAVENALENATATNKESVINNNEAVTQEEETLLDKLKKSFKAQVSF